MARATYTPCTPDCSHRGPIRFVLPSGSTEDSKEWEGHWPAGALVVFWAHTEPTVQILADHVNRHPAPANGSQVLSEG